MNIFNELTLNELISLYELGYEFIIEDGQITNFKII